MSWVISHAISAVKSETPQEPAAPPSSANSISRAANTEAKLRQRNQDLHENLELAIAAIQRLTLENHSLRQQLEAARAVTPIRPGRHAGASGSPSNIRDC